MPVADMRSKGSSSPVLCRRPAISAVLCVTIACFWTPPASSAAELQQSTPALKCEISLNNENGLLDTVQAFEFSVRLKGLKPRREEELVAIFESLAYPHRLVAFSPDDASADLTASTRFEPITAGANGQPLRMEVVVARLRGLRLETLFSRAVYLTTEPAPPAPSEAVPASARGTAMLEALLEGAPATDRNGRPVQPLLPPEEITVEELGGGNTTAVSGPVYWKQVGESVALNWQQRRAQLRKDQAGRSLRVQFRLYPGGFAQLIQVERSSGDPIVDEAGLRTVLSLHPFPPFPPDVREASVDVHIDLPGSKR